MSLSTLAPPHLLPGVHGISHIGLSVPMSFGKERQLYLGIVILRACSTEGCLPIRNVCLFNDGKGAFKSIMRRLPEQLPELPEICVYACQSVCMGWGGEGGGREEKPNSANSVSSCSFNARF